MPPIERIGHIESAAERRVAGLLAEASLGEAATAFYSVHLPRHEYKRMAEIDFLVVVKGLVLVLEVKGGRLSRDEGVWRFKNRYGEVAEKREGPFEQARSAMFAIENDLSRRVAGLDAVFGAAVITPDQDLDSDLEWDQEEHIGPASMTIAGLEQALARTIRYWRGKSKRSPSGRDFESILKVLRPDFDRVPKLSLLSGAMEADYIVLAGQQYDMLRGAESNPRILVTGGAGSGKTLLAVQTARRAALTGSTVLLTCRSPFVAEVMQKQISETGVDCRPFASIRDLDPVDVLVVDEAQDLMNVDDMLVLEQRAKGGFAQGTWRLFCDPNNQAHVDGAYDNAVFDEIRGSANLYELPYNCRNTGPVVTQTQLITGADVGIPRIGHGPQVGYKQWSARHDAAALLDAELKRLRQEDVHASDIVVVSLRDSVQDSAATLSKSYRTGRLATITPSDGYAVPLVTSSDFKGLEAPHVLVVDVDDISDEGQRSRLYVAMTRPRISLWLAVSDIAWQQMAARSGRTK